MTIRRLLIVLSALVAMATACGSDNGDSATDAATTPTESSTGATADADQDAVDVDELIEGLEETQAAQGGGGATLVVGDEQWTFDRVLCAFGPDEIGQEGAELVVSSLQDGLQLYVSIDSFGHSVSLDDIEDFENPSVSLGADQFNAELAGLPTEFIVVDGTSVTAETQFFDQSDDVAAGGTAGTLTATCP